MVEQNINLAKVESPTISSPLESFMPIAFEMTKEALWQGQIADIVR